MLSSNNELDNFSTENMSFSRSSHFANIYLNQVRLQFFSYRILQRIFVAIITHRPPPKSLDIKILKNLIKKLKMIPWERSKTHSPVEIHPTHRQDIGKVS